MTKRDSTTPYVITSAISERPEQLLSKLRRKPLRPVELVDAYRHLMEVTGHEENVLAVDHAEHRSEREQRPPAAEHQTPSNLRAGSARTFKTSVGIDVSLSAENRLNQDRMVAALQDVLDQLRADGPPSGANMTPAALSSVRARPSSILDGLLSRVASFFGKQTPVTRKRQIAGGLTHDCRMHCNTGQLIYNPDSHAATERVVTSVWSALGFG